MEKTQAYIELRLEEWARWYQCRKDGGIDYPTKSTLHQIMLKGVTVRAQPGVHYLPTNEKAEEIDDLIRLMNEGDKVMADALKKYYIGSEKTVVLMARALGISESKFKMLVKRAMAWLEGALKAYERR